MSLAKVYSRANVGIDAPLISIEVHIANGLPAFQLVGLPEASVRESRERVRSALLNCGFEFPSRRITVSLAPADLPKEGGRFDLAIAIGIIAASGQLDAKSLTSLEILGELALSGEVRGVNGVLPSASACRNARRKLLLAKENVPEANLVEGAQIYGVTSLLQVFQHLSGSQSLSLALPEKKPQRTMAGADFTDILGQAGAKRALEIGAAGGHNLLLTGPPGSGKTMLASRLVTILPPMTEQQALESATVRSVLGLGIDLATWRQRSFRQPHHTSSAAALVGGGSVPRPGEISLAHHGVLFLDELPEFERRVLDVLREPLESHEIHISRASCQARFPANFQLVAAMNPSPTGQLDDGRSTPDQILRYLNRVSGPFLDRIDLQIDVPKLPLNQLGQTDNIRGDTSRQIQARVQAARDRQLQRCGKLNSQMSHREIQQHCQLSGADQAFVQTSAERLGLSLRAYHRVCKVARSIADLEEVHSVQRHHLAQALSYRALDAIIHQLTG